MEEVNFYLYNSYAWFQPWRKLEKWNMHFFHFNTNKVIQKELCIQKWQALIQSQAHEEIRIIEY